MEAWRPAELLVAPASLGLARIFDHVFTPSLFWLQIVRVEIKVAGYSPTLSPTTLWTDLTIHLALEGIAIIVGFLFFMRLRKPPPVHHGYFHNRSPRVVALLASIT